MRHVTETHHHRNSLAFSLLVAVACLAGCSAAGSDGTALTPTDAIDETTDPVSGSLPVGTILRATTDLNLRKSPSTSSSVLDIIAGGDEVTVVKATPASGFYNVTYGSTTGWSSGKYLKVVQLGGSGGSGGSSGSSGAAGTGGGTDDGPIPGEPWSCNGSWGTTKVAGGDYYATSFGCWKDSNGTKHQDSGDNCIPACLDKARNAGLCSGMSGPQCEYAVNWYAADGGRFGCLARLQVTNPKNGRSAVVVALDYGPACWAENAVSHGIVDLSSRVTDYLFGSQMGYSDKAHIVVKEVSASTPLGPI